jgi:Arc/MetJ family transcription regulator
MPLVRGRRRVGAAPGTERRRKTLSIRATSRSYACHNRGDAYNLLMVKRTSLNLDLDLVTDARDVLQTRGTTDTIHRALEEVIRQRRLQELAERTFEELTPEALAELRRWRTDGAS